MCKFCRKFKKKITRENWRQVFSELLALNEQGKIKHIPGYPPLEDTLDIIHAESSFGVVQEFECQCGSNIKWSVQVRGEPGLWVTNPNSTKYNYSVFFVAVTIFILGYLVWHQVT